MKLNINPQFIIDLFVCTLFVFLSTTIIYFIIPNGFTSKFLLISLKLIGIILVILAVLVKVNLPINQNFKYKKKISLPNIKDFFLLALPMAPIVDYLIINIEFLDVIGFVYLFIITLIFSITIGYILPIFFSYFATLKILMFCGLMLSFIVLNMAKISILHNPGDNIFRSQIIFQGFYICLLFISLFIIYNFSKKITYVIAVCLLFSGAIYNLNNKFSDKKLDNGFKKKFY